MNSTSKKISVVIPVYNSAECVGALVARIAECLGDSDYELILVNDCSTDDSWEKVKDAGKGHKRLVGLNLRKNVGQDNALMAGFSRVSGEHIIIMDDDLQHDPGDIERLIATQVGEDADVCYANFVKKEQKWWKNMGSWFNGKMAEILIDKPPDIYLSPFKCISKRVVDEVQKNAGPYPYIDGLLFMVTRNIVQTSVEHHPRYSGRGNYTLARSFAVWLKLMMGFSVFPLRLITFVGLSTASLGLLLALYFFGKYFIIGESVVGWTSLMVVFLVFSGVILMALGFIGEYVGRLFVQANQNLPYSIKEEFRLENI